MGQRQMKNWHLITTETFDTNDLPIWITQMFKPNSFTKFMRLLDHYGSMGGMFSAGPWDWVKQPSIGLKSVGLASHIINHYSDKKVLPIFTSLETIVQLGDYVKFLELLFKLDMLEELLEASEED
jgi:hypothetical protein